MTGGSVLPRWDAAAWPDAVYEDAWCVVLDKPAGLLSVPGRGPDKQDCLASRAQQRWPDALVVHRLDMATSGLWLMARGPDVQRTLSKAFAAQQMRKRYVAVVVGRMAAPAGDDGWGEIDLPLASDWPNRPRQRIDPAHGKPSRTRWRILAASDDSTRLELEPLTGRTHQLRVHLQALGHPIVGDALYAQGSQASQPQQLPQPQQASQPMRRMLLHASALALRHPATGLPLCLSSPVPF